MSDNNKEDALGRFLGMDISGSDDAEIKSLTSELTSALNIETKTNITQNQAIVVSRAIWYARRYGSKSLDLYTRKVLLRILVSVKRGGRDDIVNALANVFRFNLEKQKAESVKV